MILPQEFHGALNDGMFRGPAKPAEALNNARGDIGGGRIDHRVVISKRNVAEEVLVVVTVKRTPATVTVLHAEQPLNSAAYGAFHALGIGVLHALERHEHKRGVVDVRIKIVAKFEGPAARFGVFVFHLPIARPEHLLREHPFRRFHQRRMIRRQAGFFQSDHGDAGIPDRRNARLHAHGVALFDFKSRKLLDFPPGQRIVRAVS